MTRKIMSFMVVNEAIPALLETLVQEERLIKARARQAKLVEEEQRNVTVEIKNSDLYIAL